MNRKRPVTSIFLASIIALSACLPGCSNFFLHAKNKDETGTMEIALGSSRSASGKVSRTILPGFVASMTRIAVDITLGATTVSQDATAANGWALSFTGLAAGTWTIDAKVFAGATQIGTGKATAAVTAGGKTSVRVPLSFEGDGSGAGTLELLVSWPGDMGINYLSWTLNGIAMTAPAITLGTTNSATLATTIAPGSYAMVLTFRRGGSAGAIVATVVEAVNIVAGMKSNSWIDSTGAVKSGMSLAPADFYDSTSRLGSLQLTGATATAAFDPAIQKYYFAGEGGNFSLTIAQGATGQSIVCTWGGSPIALTKNPDGTLSANGLAFDTAAGTNSTNDLMVTVTAPDRSTQTVYSFMDTSIRGAAALAAIASDLTGNYTLTQDIDTTTSGNWTPIGSSANKFSGSFQGGNHTIKLSTTATTDHQGLFAYIAGTGTVDQVKVEATVTNCGNTSGIIAGENAGTITNSSASGALTTTNSYIGGIVGANSGTISKSNSSVAVTTTNWFSGGVAGYNTGIIEYCYATGDVNGQPEAGGLVGENNPGVIRYCFSTGTVTGTSSIGGLVGLCNSTATVNDCYAKGKVTGTGASIGGLVGVQGDSCTIIRCYATGKVTGGTSTGGILGYTRGPVTNSFYDSTTTGMSDTGKGTGYPTATMQSATIYTNAAWNFVSDWEIDTAKLINGGYPYLKYFLTNTTAYN